MRIEQTVWTARTQWKKLVEDQGIAPQIVFIFGDNKTIRDQDAIGFVRRQYPQARIFGGTSAYEINHEGFAENSIVFTAVEFNEVKMQLARSPLTAYTSKEAAESLAAQITDKDNIGHLFVLCEGRDVNGGRIVDELNKVFPGVSISGGMAADKNTVLPNYLVFDDQMSDKCIIAVAFDKSLKVGYGAHGGWDSLGVDHKITKSDGKYVYEVDGQPALGFYKKYLGQGAGNFAEEASYFPVLLKKDLSGGGVIRSVILIDEAKDALIFSTDMPQGWYFRLMWANYHHLMQASLRSAEESMSGIDTAKKFLALIISCTGRKIVLKQKVYETIQEAADTLGNNKVVCGFYSLGEICPLSREDNRAYYHNQTMTITTLSDHE
jgi:hypothetical protein